MRKLLFVLMCLCLTAPLFGENLLVNPGFEDGDATGWGPRFGIGNVEAITENPTPHSGLYCGRDFNREANWHGIVQTQNMLDVVERGQTYPVSVWVRTNTADPVTIAVTVQYEPTGGTVYDPIMNGVADNTGWVLLEGEYTVLDNDSETATFYLETTGGAGSDTAEIYVDDASFGFDDQQSGLPYDPYVTPDNGNGTVGDLISDDEVEVTLHFKAAADPNELHIPAYPLNPNIIKHNIYLTNGSETDPNLYFLDSVTQVYNADIYLTDPNVSYGPIILPQGMAYQWQVEEVLDDGTGTPYGDGDPNNIMGSIWTFQAVGAAPEIIAGPDHVLLDGSGNGSLSVTTSGITTDLRWYKVVGEQDTEENGEVDDVMLTDTGIYSDTQTTTLVITGGTVANGAEGMYYCVAYNGDPALESTPKDVSQTAWAWVPRLVNHYMFEAADLYAVDSNSFIADTAGDSDIQLMSADTGEDLASLEPNVLAELNAVTGTTTALFLNNPIGDDPNSADGQYAQINDPYFGAYNDITISAWIYWNGTGGWQRILSIGNNNGSGTGGDTLYFTPAGNNNSGQLMLNVDGQSVTAPAGSVPEREWTYVTATLSGDTGKLYVNGQWVAEATISNNTVDIAPTANNWIGRSQWYAYDSLYDGHIDEMKIYNYALTTDEIAQDYLDIKGDWVCNYDDYDLLYDYNENCIVDLADFAIFAATWLDSYRIYPDGE